MNPARREPAERTSAIVELRNYTLHPGRRDALIALFEREFIEAQEAAGMKLLGLFRSIDMPDRFIWLRGFTDMTSRAAALATFYGGPVWKAHRDAANSTMIDSDNVLLLRPLQPWVLPNAKTACVLLTIYSFAAPAPDAFDEHVDAAVVPAIGLGGGTLLERFVTESSPNTFPALPVREGEHVYVTLASFPHVVESAIAQTMAPAHRLLNRPPEIWRLVPTARSAIR